MACHACVGWGHLLPRSPAWLWISCVPTDACPQLRGRPSVLAGLGACGTESSGLPRCAAYSEDVMDASDLKKLFDHGRLDRIMAAADKNKDGKIDYGESGGRVVCSRHFCSTQTGVSWLVHSSGLWQVRRLWNRGVVVLPFVARSRLLQAAPRRQLLSSNINGSVSSVPSSALSTALARQRRLFCSRVCGATADAANARDFGDMPSLFCLNNAML